VFGSDGDANSKTGDPLFANKEVGIFSLLNSSPAQSGAASGNYIGAHLSEIGWYNDTLIQSGINLSQNIEFKNTSLGSGAIVFTDTIGSGEQGGNDTNTVLLIHMDGASGSTSFTDDSSSSVISFQTYLYKTSD